MLDHTFHKPELSTSIQSTFLSIRSFSEGASLITPAARVESGVFFGKALGMGALFDYAVREQTLLFFLTMSLIIDPTTIPEDGLALNGELSADIFAFPAHDEATPVSPLQYDIFVQRFGSELLLTGCLVATFELTCVVTMQRFRQTIRLQRAAIAVELENEQPLEIADLLREEIVIEMPTDPRCDEGDEPMECKINSLHLILDKPTESDADSSPPLAGDQRWSALDALHNRNDNT